MRDNLSIFIMIIVLVILAVIFPLYNNFQRQDDMSYNLVLKATTNFVDEVINCGYISQEMYDNYVSNIANTGNLYDIELEAHKKVLTKVDGSNDYEEQYFVDYNDEIFDFSADKSVSGTGASNLDKRVLKGGTYYLNVDDEIYVKVKNSSTTMAGAIFNLIVPTATEETIKVNYGGKVKNNAWLQADVYSKEGISLIFDLNGGYNQVASMTQQMFNGETSVKFKIPKNEPSKKGAKFLGWSKDKNATSATYKYNGEGGLSSQIEITDDTVLYAIWYMPSRPALPVISAYSQTNGWLNSGVWSRSAVVVNIKLSKPEADTKIQYSTDGSTWKDYTEQDVINSVRGIIYGQNSDVKGMVIYARTCNTKVDGIYSKGEVTFTVNVDKTSPTTPTNIEFTSAKNAITLKTGGSSDEGSGVGKYQYSRDGINWQDNATFYNFENKKTYTFYTRAVDNAGNVSNAKSANYQYIAPSYTISIDWDNNGSWDFVTEIDYGSTFTINIANHYGHTYREYVEAPENPGEKDEGVKFNEKTYWEPLEITVSTPGTNIYTFKEMEYYVQKFGVNWHKEWTDFKDDREDYEFDTCDYWRTEEHWDTIRTVQVKVKVD